MELNEDPFWQELRTRTAGAEAELAAELAEAEQFLDAIDDDAEARLPEAQIDAMVERATSTATTPRLVEVQPEPSGPSGHPAASGPFVRIRHHLAAAAAFLLAPKFLIATTAVTAVTVTSFLLQYTTHTLPFQDAVIMMMDDDGAEAERRSSQQRVYVDLLEGILLLRQVSSESPAIADQAASMLTELRAILESGGAFEPAYFPEPLAYLHTRVADRGLSLELRREALHRFGDQLAYGMHAIKAAERAPGPEGFRRDNQLCRRQLADHLGL